MLSCLCQLNPKNAFNGRLETLEDIISWLFQRGNITTNPTEHLSTSEGLEGPRNFLLGCYHPSITFGRIIVKWLQFSPCRGAGSSMMGWRKMLGSCPDALFDRRVGVNSWNAGFCHLRTGLCSVHRSRVDCCCCDCLYPIALPVLQCMPSDLGRFHEETLGWFPFG